MGALWLCAWPIAQANPGCLNQSTTEHITLARVTDGDTIVLADHRRVRLIGLNALELSAQSAADRTLAKQAAQALEALLTDQALSLIEGLETHDRHGRTLGHVQLADGRNASLALITQGLALAVAVGKNTRCAQQSLAAEHIAGQHERGVWQHPGDWYVQGDSLPVDARGFHLVSTTVRSVLGKGRQRRLVLSNGLHVKLGRDWPEATDATLPSLATLPGRRVEVRGWLSAYKGRPTLTLHHPANLAVLPE